MHIDIIDNMIFREWLNGGLLPLNVSLLLAIGFSLLRARILHGRTWTQVPGISTACALWWIFLADGIRACAVWITLRDLNRGGPVFPVEPLLTQFLVVAAFIAVLASLRCIFLFTPRSIGHWGWIFALISTVAFVVGSHLS